MKEAHSIQTEVDKKFSYTVNVIKLDLSPMLHVAVTEPARKSHVKPLIADYLKLMLPGNAGAIYKLLL